MKPTSGTVSIGHTIELDDGYARPQVTLDFDIEKGETVAEAFAEATALLKVRFFERCLDDMKMGKGRVDTGGLRKWLKKELRKAQKESNE